MLTYFIGRFIDFFLFSWYNNRDKNIERISGRAIITICEGNMKILIAEDDKGLRKLLYEQLTGEGY